MSDQVPNQPDPREVFRQCIITEDEFAIILDYHRDTIMAQQYESIALRTHSTCFLRRAIHAVERLKALAPATWQRVNEELDLAIPGWIEQANAEDEWEMDVALEQLVPDTEEEWESFVAYVEERCQDGCGSSDGTLIEWEEIRPY